VVFSFFVTEFGCSASQTNKSLSVLQGALKGNNETSSHTLKLSALARPMPLAVPVFAFCETGLRPDKTATEMAAKP
jgi:hypothetical protein